MAEQDSLNSARTDGLQSSSTDIAIVGGGMVGISLALMLAQQNAAWRITLIEALDFQAAAEQRFQSSFDARSTALSAGSQDLLEQLGIWSELQQHATAIRRVHVSDRGHFGGSLINACDYGRAAVGHVVENAWLGQVLTRALQRQHQIRCLAPASVSTARAVADGYRIQVHSRVEGGTGGGAESDTRATEMHCSLLVLADGVQSRLREQLGVDLISHDYGQSAIITNVRCDCAHGGVAYERFTSDGPIALLPLGESDSSHDMALVWTRPESEAPELLNASESTFLRELQREFGYRQGVFTATGKRHLYRLTLDLAREQRRRSLVLMGNAAHSLHPVAGQGFNLALRDCAALAQALATGCAEGRALSDLGLLDDYLARQGDDQRRTIQLSDTFVRWFSSGEIGRSVLRNIGLFALDALPLARHALARQTMGLR